MRLLDISKPFFLYLQNYYRVTVGVMASANDTSFHPNNLTLLPRVGHPACRHLKPQCF